MQNQWTQYGFATPPAEKMRTNAMTKKAFDKIAEGLKEALTVARGHEADDAPELSSDWFAGALLKDGERVILPRYAVLIDGSTGAYGVVVPDLPGCTAMGKTIDDALRNVALAATDWLKDAASSGAVIPPARTIEILQTDCEVTAALANGALLAVMPETE